MEKIRFEDIIIPEAYAKTTPKPEKIQACVEIYKKENQLDRWLVLTPNNTLIDGYIGYLALKQLGYSGEIEVQVEQTLSNKYKKRELPSQRTYRNVPTKYVYAHHIGKTKSYVWRLTPNKFNENISVNQKIVVNTKGGKRVVVVDDVKILSKCPVETPVKKVVRVYR